MSPLNIHPEENVTSAKKKNNKMLKVMLGIGALVLVPVIGTTLASQININGGTNNDAQVFGQGVRKAVACDESVVMTAVANFLYGNYRLDKITIDDIDSSATDPVTGLGCDAKKFVISTAITADNVGDAELGLAVPISPATAPIRAEATINGGANLGCNVDYFGCTFVDGLLTITMINDGNQFGINAYDVGRLLIQQTN
jgi:hypothetical protein